MIDPSPGKAFSPYLQAPFAFSLSSPSVLRCPSEESEAPPPNPIIIIDNRSDNNNNHNNDNNKNMLLHLDHALAFLR